jgi:hypothetical protein
MPRGGRGTDGMLSNILPQAPFRAWYVVNISYRNLKHLNALIETANQ